MKRAWLVALLACGVILARPARGQIRGTIFGPGNRAFPMAVSPLHAERAGDEALANQFADIVSRDLTLSGLVRIIPREQYIESAQDSGITADTINFGSWSVIGAVALTKGTLERDGDHLTVEARLFDVYQRRQLAGRRYRGGAGELRRMAHRFADEVMAQLTGERGPFDSLIAFLSTRGGRFKDVYVMSVDGGDVRRITSNDTINLSPAWAPDARGLLVTSYGARGPALFSVDVSSRRLTRVPAAKGVNLMGRWSPDGSQIAVTFETDGNSDIAILSRDGSLRRRVTDHWAIDVSPSWSPDGSQIAFCSSRSGAPQIYVTSVDGGQVRKITYDGSYNTSPNWSPKGDRVAYASRIGGSFQIFTVRTDGTDVRQITQSGGSNEDPSWSPDGRYLVFSSTRSGRARLYVSDLTGNNQAELTEGNGDDTSPAWSRWLE